MPPLYLQLDTQMISVLTLLFSANWSCGKDLFVWLIRFISLMGQFHFLLTVKLATVLSTRSRHSFNLLPMKCRSLYNKRPGIDRYYSYNKNWPSIWYLSFTKRYYINLINKGLWNYWLLYFNNMILNALHHASVFLSENSSSKINFKSHSIQNHVTKIKW